MQNKNSDDPLPYEVTEDGVCLTAVEAWMLSHYYSVVPTQFSYHSI